MCVETKTTSDDEQILMWRKWRQKLVLSFRKGHAPMRDLPPFILQTLEPKLLLSAELAGGVAVDLLEPDQNPSLADQPLDQLVDHWQGVLPAKVEAQSTPSTSPSGNDLLAIIPEQSLEGDTHNQWLAHAAQSANDADGRSLELIIVDPNTPDYLSLMNGLQQDNEREYLIYMLDGERDGVAQVSELLESHRDLDAVHLISHGNEDGFQIGGSWLSQESLGDYENAISQWRTAFDTEADILIYGCDLAANENGQALVDALAELTGADVAASNDLTGHTDLGGDWELEYQQGQVETQPLFNAQSQQSWQFTLGVPGTNNGFMFTSKDGVSGLPTDGITEWGAGEIVEFANPGLNLEASDSLTAGSFASLFDLSSFNSGGSSNDNSAKTNALHYVTSSLTIGTDDTFALEAGDLLLSVDKDEGFSGTNGTLEVQQDDIFLFRPDASGDYSAGSFFMLFENVSSGSKTLNAFTLIEQDVTVGGTPLSAGDLLFAQADDGGDASKEDIHFFDTVNVGSGSTQGLTSVIFFGAELGFTAGVFGLEVIESDTHIGGQAFNEGNVLFSLESADDSLADNGLSVTEFDVVRLDVSSTSLLGVASADADLVFDGSDAGLGGSDTEIYGLSLVSVDADPSALNMDQTLTYVEGSNNVTLKDIIVSDITSGDTITATLTLSNTSTGQLSTGTFGASSSTYDSGTGVWTISGTLTDVNAALADVTFLPVGSNTAASTINTHVEDSAGNGPADGSIALSVQPQSLWMSTKGPATYDDGAAGNAADVVAFAGTDLNLESGDGTGDTTDGSFSTLYNFAENVRALHYVSAAVTVDTLVGGVQGSYDLQEGQVVLSMRAGDKNDFDLTTVGGGTISVNNTDLLVYTPWANTYEFLLEDAILKPNASAANIHAISIVEQETTIGVDTTLAAGTYIVARSDGAVHADISTYNNTDGRQDLLLGTDFLSDSAQQIQGLELVENEVTLGGQTIAQGSILITVKTDDPLTIGTSGGTTVLANQIDVVALTVNATEQDSSPDTNVDASILFDGSDVALAIADGGGSGEINGLSLATPVSVNEVPTATNTNQTQIYAEGYSAVELDDIVVSDADTDEIITATLTLDTLSAGSLTTGSFGSATSSYDSGTGVWSVSGSVTDVNAALASVAFIPEADNTSNAEISVHIEDASGEAPADGTISLNVATPTSGLLLNTKGEVSGASSPGLSDWGNDDVLQFGDPNLTFDPTGTPADTTDGTFSISFSLDVFDLVNGSTRFNAMHYVSQDITVGSGASFDLQAGDLLLSTISTETLTSLNSITVDEEDVFVFRPLHGADYSQGSFYMLLEDLATSGENLNAISLVESETVVGGTTLTAGSFLFAQDDEGGLLGSRFREDIYVFDPSNVGAGATSGITSLLVDGSDINITGQVYGLELIEENTALGGTPLTAGQILYVDNVDGSIGDNSLSITKQDVAILDVTRAEDGLLFPTTAATASLFFDGSDVGLTGTTQELDALSMIVVNETPTVDNAIADQAATEDTAFNFTFAANTFSDADVGDTLTYSATLSGGGALPGWLSFDANTRTFSGTPLNDDVGTITVEVTATDDEGARISDSFDITVANTNDDPTVDNVIADQSATEDSAFSFTFAANTFGDVDATDSLSYSAQLSGGGVLPSWLSFDGGTRTFSGTPLNANVGTVSIEVTAEDGSGATASDTFDITVANTNDDPTVDNAIADQSATEDSAFSFTFAANTFGDVDASDSLSYSAQLSGGGALPAWLSFDANTRTFSGTPLNANVGTVSIEVTAEDGSGATASDTFDITVANTNDDPTVDNAIADQSATEDSAFSFTFAANTFGDVDASDSLSYSAQLSGGGVLPAWLSFDGGTRTFSGTPLNANVGTVSIEVTAEDGSGATVSDTFDLTVANTNDDPTVDNAIADQSATEDNAFSFTFAANTFGDVDASDSLSYSAQLSGGGALPAWLSFDSATRTFSGTPDNDDVGIISVEVTAQDSIGASVSDIFDISIANQNDSPTGGVSIDGVPTEDQTLTVDTSALADDDGLGTLSYQWLRDGVAITDATFSTYTLGDDDVAEDISVRVDYTDARGTDESVTSASVTIANVNDVPTGSVAIFGSATQGATLTASNDLADDDGLGTIVYQWQRSGLDIGGATGNTYTLTGDDVGETIRVVASYTDAQGTNESRISVSTAVVTATNTLPTGSVVINGTPVEDNTLSADTSSLADADVLGTLFYQWQRDGVNIAGATGSTYTLGDDDVGKAIRVLVSYTDGGGTAEGVSSAASAAVVNVNDTPTLDNAIADQNATEDSAFSFTFAFATFSDVDPGDVLTYSAQLSGGGVLPAWLSFDAGTRTFSGTPMNADVASLDVEVFAEDVSGASVSDVFTINVANTNDAPTLIQPIPDQAATEDTAFSYRFAANTFNDVDAGDSLTYTARLADGSPLPDWLSFDAATRTFSGTPLNGDVGSIQVEITAEDGSGEVISDTFGISVANSNDAPTLDQPIPDQIGTEDAGFSYTFAANTFSDEDASDSLTYTARLADGTALPGWLTFDGASRTFSGTPANGDVGTIRVEVVAEDGSGASATDTFDIAISNTNDVPAGAMTIEGLVQQGETLSLNTASVSDDDGLGAFTYQWLRDGVVIPDASEASYTLTQADVGAVISATASYTDGAGTLEQLNAVTSIAVLNIDDPLTGKVKIQGAGLVSERLMADVSNLNDADGIDGFSYQWLRGGIAIAGATGSSYTVQQEDAGKSLSVRVSVIDNEGNLSSSTSRSLGISADTETELPELPELPDFPVRVEPVPEPDRLISEDPDEEEEAQSEEASSEESLEEESSEELAEEEVSAFLEDAGFEDQASFIDGNGFDFSGINSQGIERSQTLVGQNIETRNVDGLAGVVANAVVPAEEASYQPGVTGILSVNDPLFLVRSNSFLNGLDDMRENVNDSADVTQAVVGSSLAVSAGMSAGYVAWLARSGILLSSVMSSLPVWRLVDPLPVLTGSIDGSGGDGESLESLVAGDESAGEHNKDNDADA